MRPVSSRGAGRCCIAFAFRQQGSWLQQPKWTSASHTGKGGTGGMSEASRINRRSREWQEPRLAGQLEQQPGSLLPLPAPGLAPRPPDGHLTVPESSFHSPRIRSLRLAEPGPCLAQLLVGREVGKRGREVTGRAGVLLGLTRWEPRAGWVNSGSQATTGLTTAQARGSSRTKFYVTPFSPDTASFHH